MTAQEKTALVAVVGVLAEVQRRARKVGDPVCASTCRHLGQAFYDFVDGRWDAAQLRAWSAHTTDQLDSLQLRQLSPDDVTRWNEHLLALARGVEKGAG